MVTMHRLISLDAVGREGEDLIHLTGPLQVVARVAMDLPDGMPPEMDLRVNGARVRGVGLKTGARYRVEGVHQSRHWCGKLASPFDVWARFELLGCTPAASQITCLTLAVRFQVTVPPDGRVKVEASDVELLSEAREHA